MRLWAGGARWHRVTCAAADLPHLWGTRDKHCRKMLL